jgi:hypothetical protein
LMWDMRRTVNSDAFPIDRIVVQFEYPDASDKATNWWLVSEGGDVDLCLTEPAGEVDIVIKSPLAKMTAVWTCQVTFEEAVKQGDIQVFGAEKLVARLQDWLQSSALSRLGALGESPGLEWKAS